MVYSMTGFASTTITLTAPNNTQTQVNMSLKSLNSRYFEATCKFPFALQHLETRSIKLLKKQFLRGHVYFTIYMTDHSFLQGKVNPALPTAKSYIEALETIQKTFDVAGTVAIADLVRLPIFSIEERSLDSHSEQQIMEATQELALKLLEVRQVEGAALQKDLEGRCAKISDEIHSIETAAETIMADRKKLIAKKIAELGVHEEEYSNMRRHALYTELDKIDIHEEIVRFKTHIKALKQIIEADYAEKGRRIDFTLQELGREINTIAAKCSDAVISSMAINIKVELEKAREQAQNIV